MSGEENKKLEDNESVIKKKTKKIQRYFNKSNDPENESVLKNKKKTQKKSMSNKPRDYVDFGNSTEIKSKDETSLSYIDIDDVDITKPDEVVEVSMKEKKFFPKNKNFNKPNKIKKELLEKYSKGEPIDTSGVKTKFFKEKLKRREVYYKYATEQSARTEILLSEEKGFAIPNENERISEYSQSDIVKNVDITAATKHFQLRLDFGPYNLRYTKNGRHLLLGGKMGHVAAFDWISKKLHCEMNVMEEVADVCWLHVETMFACAQKTWMFFYDNKGTEIHCVKQLNNVNKLEFLPYHFLLACGSSKGFLSWLDISIGEIVGNYNSKLGDIRIMKQNPMNAVICVGSGNGVVSMWSPKVREPLAKILCHSTPLTAIAVDPKGMHLVTSGIDKKIKVWDIRELNGPLAEYKLKVAAKEIDISQRGVLAFSYGNICQTYSETIINENTDSYIRHRCTDFIHSLRFCPYEDVLGIGTSKGFESILIPGSGEPNFDAFEANPFQTKSQRRENEIHALLEKIPPELITLDSNEIAGVDVTTLKEKIEAKKNIFFIKPPKIDFKSRRKMKGKGGSVNAARNKQIVKDMARKKFIEEIRQRKKEIIEECKVKNEETNDYIPLKTPSTSVLDRFKSKKKK